MVLTNTRTCVQSLMLALLLLTYESTVYDLFTNGGFDDGITAFGTQVGILESVCISRK